MKILFAGPPSPTLWYLRTIESEVRSTEKPITAPDADFIVSHGYRHIIKADVLAQVPAINLHIAFLPYNRGAAPNFWSVYEGTPSGVTVHYMDAGIDTGPIVAQRLIDHHPGDTFATSYSRLQREMTALFMRWWPLIRRGEAKTVVQRGPGSYHAAAELEPLEHLLTDGWDTPISAVAPRLAA